MKINDQLRIEKDPSLININFKKIVKKLQKT